MAKIVGVLGGMGPAATVDFMSRVIAATRAESDQEHIRLLVDHNPGVPNRHDAIAGRSPGLGPQLAEMARGLEIAGADFLVMVCNTAHAFTEEINNAISIPFVSMVEVTVDAAVRTGAKRVGVMAATGCLQAGLYQESLARQGIEPLTWDPEALERFMATLYQIKAGKRERELEASILGLSQLLVSDGAEALIAGCTEIPLVLDVGLTTVPMLSSTDMLVARTIELAKGEQ